MQGVQTHGQGVGAKINGSFRFISKLQNIAANFYLGLGLVELADQDLALHSLGMDRLVQLEFVVVQDTEQSIPNHAHNVELSS